MQAKLSVTERALAAAMSGLEGAAAQASELREELSAERRRAAALSNGIKDSGVTPSCPTARAGNTRCVGISHSAVNTSTLECSALAHDLRKVRKVSCEHAPDSFYASPLCACDLSAWTLCLRKRRRCCAEARLQAAKRREGAARHRAEANVQLLHQRLKAAESKVISHDSTAPHSITDHSGAAQQMSHTGVALSALIAEGP